MAKETKEPTIPELREKGVALARARRIKTPTADALLDFQVWNGWANERRAQIRAAEEAERSE
ncbi:hypothetical protein K2P56_04575 [Patescibacteria group bacterium]|nr:hypothetical protein [Patescibacteria group bacterium]